MNMFVQFIRSETISGIDMELSGHAQMHQQRVAALQREIDLFASPFGADDLLVLGALDEFVDRGRRNAGQTRPGLDNGFAHDLRFELGADCFGFGKFWHSGLGVRIWNIQIRNWFPDAILIAVVITSRQHPLIKLARSLHNSKGRRENGLFLIEGKNAVTAALNTDFPIREVLAGEDEGELSEIAADKGIEVRRATSEIMAYASEVQSALPAIAFGEIPAGSSAILPNFTLILDGISDPGNVGTLWRAADAAGAGGVLGLGGADPYSPKVVRSAAGSTFHLPPLTLENADPASLITLLQEQEIAIVSAEAHGGQNCYDFEWPERAALVLGHETRGVSPELDAAANHRITIPIFGRAESLNAAMAGTILLFSWAQSRHRSKNG
jgi:TrmH family RNA methyltransferase